MYCTHNHNRNKLNGDDTDEALDSARPVEWISHRGLCYPGVENTLQAFHWASEAGFRHFETDLRCTADGVVVLWHDQTLARGSGHKLAQQPIQNVNWTELQKVRLHDGQSLCTLESVFEHFWDRRWILDIKPDSAPQTLARLVVRLERSPQWKAFLSEHVRFLVWSAKHQKQLAKDLPSARFMPRLSECRRAGFCNLLGLPALSGVQAGRAYAVPPSIRGINLMTPTFLAHYQRRGARVLAYLPDSDAEVQAALAAGADEILLNGAPAPLKSQLD